jgi:50S ribosomal subunit-associated GTPase HflX
MDDAEEELDKMAGLENTWNGRVLARLVRAARQSHNRTVLLNTKVQELEQRIQALEQP